MSGLALGCDTYAHQGCVEASGKAVAVMAHGLDYIYPKANTNLADLILKTGGVLVSEYPPGVKPEKWFFTARDRLQSALSDIVIIIETGLKGGTQHTIKAAIEQKKKLICVSPVDPYLDHEKTQGTLKLIRDGKAYPIGSSVELPALIERYLNMHNQNYIQKQLF